MLMTEVIKMIKEIQSFQLTNIYGKISALREIDGVSNLYEAEFVFDTSVDICALNGQDFIDYIESLNLNWILI
jgi:hypothetical protein